MPIVFSMPNRHILLSDQKVAQVLNANTVQEATRINNIAEFVSGIIDWFRGGTQKKEIIALFHSLQESQSGATAMPEYRRLEKFIQLRRLALPEYQSQFQLQILALTARYDWGYALKVNGQTLFQCDNVIAKSKNGDADPLPFFHAANLRMKMEDAVYQTLRLQADGALHYLPLYKKAMLSHLFDVKHTDLDCLMDKLQTREYRLENLETIDNYKYGISFDAVFKNGNRISISDANAAAWRAGDETLREKLASKRYADWDALLGEGYRSKDDRVLRALTAPLKRDYCDVIHHAEVLTAPGLCDFHNALREIAIADTDLFDLWDLANEVGGYEDDRLSCGVGDHLLNLQCGDDDAREDDVDSLSWLDDSGLFSDCDGGSESVESLLAAMPPMPSLTPLASSLPLTSPPLSPLSAIASRDDA
ncbi:hypothetical protein [Sodalis praecaptivus]|uniref:hypothetical protein n=1 Tax=Sodalis praecaptivus TaxID=1239307 RepID=UPI0027FB4F4B|nr:hypothetical protein [Sodalis praecaptivus]CAJ0994432.1 hypothetical protein NVIRENTERO_01408 [Sodalis praecaptivus]